MPNVLSPGLTHKGNDLVDVTETTAINANARVTVRKNTGADVGTRRRINFVEGAGVTITVTDVGGSEEVIVNVAASGAAPSKAVPLLLG